jgi:S1-C subfamily serine protease
MKISIRMWILIIALLLSVLAIRPGFGTSGVLVTSVGVNSSIYEAGLRPGEIIVGINGQEISSSEE